MSLKICSLASGSRGNSVLLAHDSATLLIDAGLSLRELKRRLNEIGKSPKDIGIVLCTHSHIDHCKGIKVFCETNNVTAHTHSGGVEALYSFTKLSKLLLSPFQGTLKIGEIEIDCVQVKHDVPCCTGFVFRVEGKKICYFTDLGCYDLSVLSAVEGADLLFIESNHDIDMLSKGSYPYPLKRRILSEHGHLSNAACAEVVLHAVKSGTQKIILGHLSQQNNLPELAFYTVSERLKEENLTEGKDYHLYVALQDTVSSVIEI